MTQIITRTIAVKNLKKYIGRDLMEVADEVGVTTYKNGKQNKGWKGLVLERLAGLEQDNSRAPNGLDFELKSVSFKRLKNGTLTPKETMAITMINPAEVKKNSFFESHVWAKLKSMVFCAVMWHGKNAKKSELLDVASLDFLREDDIVKEIEEDYDFIKEKIITEGFESLTGRYGKWIQPRTKGSGHGSTTRAFYARKNLVTKIFELAD